jgi:hypothetical protein
MNKKTTRKILTTIISLAATIGIAAPEANAYWYGPWNYGNGYTNGWYWPASMIGSLAWPVTSLIGASVRANKYYGYPPAYPISMHRNQYGYYDNYGTAGQQYPPPYVAPYKTPYIDQYQSQSEPQPKNKKHYSANKQPVQTTRDVPPPPYSQPMNVPSQYAANVMPIYPTDPGTFINFVNNKYGGNISQALFDPNTRQWARSMGLVGNDDLFDVNLNPENIEQMRGILQHPALDPQTKIQSLAQALRMPAGQMSPVQNTVPPYPQAPQFAGGPATIPY